MLYLHRHLLLVSGCVIHLHRQVGRSLNTELMHNSSSQTQHKAGYIWGTV